jgi:hypothetical protein
MQSGLNKCFLLPLGASNLAFSFEGARGSPFVRPGLMQASQKKNSATLRDLRLLFREVHLLQGILDVLIFLLAKEIEGI